MKNINITVQHSAILFLIILSAMAMLWSQETDKSVTDSQVSAFLEAHQNQWRDMNIPASDGKLLYDLIVDNGYTRAVEVGTSTGRSTIWMAWAMSKTGGNVITIEINERRYKQALINFEKAGLSDYIDARLADAHELVPKLKGPFDFVFIDADKNWYTNYFKALAPKLEGGGCFSAHNVWPPGSGRYALQGTRQFYNHVKKQSNFKTRVDESGNGLAISFKTAEKP